MGYKWLDEVDNLNKDKKKNEWQFRIAVDPRVLFKNSDNKIEEIKAELELLLKDLPFKAKVAVIDSDEEYENDYNGILSSTGKDCSQVGKEICIYMADRAENHLSVEEYKVILLRLWKRLQASEIPLQCREPRGDAKIFGPDDLPTPFSLTSINPPDEQGKQEWEYQHGILFKEFKSEPGHPILDVKFTEQDLQDAGIGFDSRDISDFYDEQFVSVSDKENIVQKVKSINESKKNYHELLFSDDRIDGIRRGIAELRDELNATNNLTMDTLSKELKKTIYNEDDLEEHKITVRKRIQDDVQYYLSSRTTDIYFLIHHYPHLNNSEFAENQLVKDLELAVVEYNIEKFNTIIEQLRSGLETQMVTIFNNYTNTSFEDESGPQNPAQNNFIFDYGKYFNTNEGAEIWDLIRKDPKGMQIIYRNAVLLDHEENAKNKFEENKPNAKFEIDPADGLLINNKMQAIQLYNKAMAGIANYQARFKEGEKAAHLGFWAKLFDSKRGFHRSEIYQTGFKDSRYNVQQKLLLLCALLGSYDGKTLQEDVTQAMGYETNVEDALRDVKKLVKNIYADENAAAVYESTLENLGSFANKPSPSKGYIIPENMWDEVSNVGKVHQYK